MQLARAGGRSRAAPAAAILQLAGAIASSGLGACSDAPTILPLVHTSGAPVVATPSPSIPLEIVTRSTAVPDPLPVRGSNVAFTELEAALGAAVATATAPWSEAHRRAHAGTREGGGWALLVELTGADAQLDGGGRLVVGFDARATLRTRRGNDYLGQTQLACREGGLVFTADRGAPVVYRCAARIGRELTGWLDAVPLDPPPAGPK